MQSGKFKKELYEASGEGKIRLRIGILLDSDDVPAVVAEVIQDVLNAKFTDIVLIVQKAPTEHKQKSAFERVWAAKQHILNPHLRKKVAYTLYSRIDKSCVDDLGIFASENLTQRLSNVPRLTVKPIETGFTDRFSENDVLTIKQANIDVMLRFGFRILRGEILAAAKYGIWSYHHGDNVYYRGAPPYFWEAFEKRSRSGVILQILNDKLDAGLVIAKGQFATQNQLSTLRNQLAPYVGAQHFVIQNLRKLHTVGWDDFVKSALPSEEYLGKRSIYKTPTNKELIIWLARQVIQKTIGRLNPKHIVSHWKIGIRRRAKPIDANGFKGLSDLNGLTGFQWIESPRGHFWADPLLVDWKGKTYLFFEDYNYVKRRGVIACAEVLESGELAMISTVIDTGGHASFPQHFEYDGNHYLIPETTDAGAVSLYVASDFPRSWKKIKNLLDMPCVDTVVWQANDRWWLHTVYDFKVGAVHTSLLFSAKTPLSEWTAHPASPLLTDVRFARNGGRVIAGSDGEIYRVSQSSEFSYGSSFSFHKVVNLSESVYEEQLESRVFPAADSRMRGTHTYSRSSDFEVIDGVWNVRQSMI